MEYVFEQKVTVTKEDVTETGVLKLSALLHMVQEAATGHCKELSLDWDSMCEKGMFWAVLRHRVQINRLPEKNESLLLQTWPLPTTRTAYPRAVQALDEKGNVVFSVVSLWVLMDMQTRAMLLPGKIGVTVEGITRGCELPFPASLPPCVSEQRALWTVTRQDLDVNNHVNNAKYLDHAQALAGQFGATHTPKELTVCYLSEVLLGQEITLQYTLSQEGVLLVDGCRWRTGVPGKTERVFAIRLSY